MLWMGYTHLFVLSVTCMQLHAHDSRDILQVVEVRSRCLSIIGTESNCIEHGCMYIRTFLRTGHSKQNITLYVQSIHEYVHTYVCICLCCKLSAVYVRTRVGLCVWCSALVKSLCGWLCSHAGAVISCLDQLHQMRKARPKASSLYLEQIMKQVCVFVHACVRRRLCVHKFFTCPVLSYLRVSSKGTAQF